MRSAVRGLLVCLAIAWPGLRAAETGLPPAPRAYFNDYANLVRPETASALNAELDAFERATSNQILVAIYPNLPPEAAIEDYTQRAAQAWHAGQKGRDNGAVLFVFKNQHQMYIQTGYGLEGALPDAICKRIIEDEIVPKFRSGDFDGGMTAGVDAIMAAARGEYRGNGRTAGENRSRGLPPGIFFIIFLAIVAWSMARSRRHVVYGRNGRVGVWGGGPWIFPGGGGGWSGGSMGGGGGGFSGGGGSFGGGGAGGSW